MNQAVQHAKHREFLNAYYGISRHFYDLTRKYYLLGRDAELRKLAHENWDSLVEVGPGTGRNLIKLHHRRPDALFFGIEASDEMLARARKRCPFARLSHGFAENCAIESTIGRRPDRILFSYCLSMVEDPKRAIDNARAALAPGGEVVVVDFGDAAGFPNWFRGALKTWLSTFHVQPPKTGDYERWGGRIQHSFGGYALHARFAAFSNAS